MLSTVTLKLFYDGSAYLCVAVRRLTVRGVPAERPIPDLPSERPDFKLLYGSDPSAKLSYAASPSNVKSTQDQVQNAEKGLAYSRAPVGYAGRTNDADVTDKMTLTWVSTRPHPEPGQAADSIAWAIDILRDYGQSDHPYRPRALRSNVTLAHRPATVTTQSMYAGGAEEGGCRAGLSQVSYMLGRSE